MADEQGCDSRISANGGVLLPGLVDAHTHPVFAGDRVHEFAMKLAGATYMEVVYDFFTFLLLYYTFEFSFFFLAGINSVSKFALLQNFS